MNIFIQENTFENAVSEMAAILCQPQCVNSNLSDNIFCCNDYVQIFIAMTYQNLDGSKLKFLLNFNYGGETVPEKGARRSPCKSPGWRVIYFGTHNVLLRPFCVQWSMQVLTYASVN